MSRVLLERLFTPIGILLAVAAYIGAMLLLIDTLDSFQLVSATTFDWLVGLGVALAGPAIVAWPRRARRPTDAPGLPLDRLFIGTAVFGGLIGSATLLAANALLDFHPKAAYSGIIMDKYCGRNHRWTVFAPTLESGTFSIEGATCAADIGDSVFLQVGPGAFGRAWIASYRYQSAQDRANQAIHQHRHR